MTRVGHRCNTDRRKIGNQMRWLFVLLLALIVLRGCAEREVLGPGEACTPGCSADPCRIDLACCHTAGSGADKVCAIPMRCMIRPPDGWHDDTRDAVTAGKETRADWGRDFTGDRF